MTTHYIDEAETLCGQIAFIRSGRIVAEGTPEALRTRYGGERLEDVYLTIMGESSSMQQVPDSSSLTRAPRRPAIAVPQLGPAQRRGTVALAGREVHRVLVLWTQTIVPPVLTACLYLLVFGGALGARLRSIEGVPYLSFILPGLLVMTVAGQAFGNNATSIFQAKYEGYIEDVLSSPIAAWRIALAYSVGGLVRSFMVAVVVALAAAPFVQSMVNPLVVLVALALTALLFAALGVVTGIWAETFDQLSFVANLVIAPLSLVAGVFYSASALPGAWRLLTRLDPIYYLVAAARNGFLGLTEAPVLLSMAIGGGVTLGLFAWAIRLLARGWRLKP